MNREETIERLLVNPKVSVLIVGAGIYGVSAFRDLALQGVDVLLVDRGDYCSGASASSIFTLEETIRHPEKKHARQMQKVAAERTWLLANIPHLVQAQPNILPTFRLFAGALSPRQLPDWDTPPMDLGSGALKKWLHAYTRANRGGYIPTKPKFTGRQKSREQFPKLNRRVRGTATYLDAAIPRPERICIEMIQDTLAASNRAFAANYVEMDRVESNQVVLVDKLNDEQFSVEPSLVINATGPWADETNNSLGHPSETLTGSKSVHLVVDNPALRDAIHEHTFHFGGQETPGIFISPLEDKVLIGASGFPLANRHHPRCTPEEIEHFFRLTGLLFPEIPLERSQIIFQIARVLPTPSLPENGNGSHAPRIEKLPAGTVADFPVLTVVGGAWTSVRKLTDQVTEAVLEFFQIPRQMDTDDLPVGGSKGLPHKTEELDDFRKSLVEKYGAPAKLVEILVRRYGTKAEAFLNLRTLVSPTGYWPFSGYTPEEIDLLTKEEDVITLDDLIVRRTMIGKLGLLDGEGLNALAEIVAAAKGWSDEFKQEEIDRTVTIMRDQYGVRLRPE
ncbi:FAD-dependent oxidoreductase [bacterium]|nr:FAD-dependent oxidoreductase [bacterium]MCB2179090.1 FAD-dependent oxidoreductase [bacterium]